MSAIKLGVSGILLHSNKVLLGRRVKDDPSLPGMWCSPGGGVEFGETLVQALAREFMEEVGLSIEIIDSQPFIAERIHDDRHTVMPFYRVQRNRPCNVIVGDGFDAVDLFDKKTIKSLAVTPITIAALKHFKFT